MSRATKRNLAFFVFGVAFAVALPGTEKLMVLSFIVGVAATAMSSDWAESLTALAFSVFGVAIATMKIGFIAQRPLYQIILVSCYMGAIFAVPWIVAAPLGRRASNMQWIQRLARIAQRKRTESLFFLVSGAAFWSIYAVAGTKAALLASSILSVFVAAWASDLSESLLAVLFSACGWFITMTVGVFVANKNISLFDAFYSCCIAGIILYSPWAFAVPLGRLASKLRWVQKIRGREETGSNRV